jgi:hypothetical protein
MGFQLQIHELEEQEVITYLINNGRFQRLHGLWPGFAAAILLGLRVPFPHVAWTPVSVVCFHLEVSATGRFVVQRSPTLCVCVTECDQMHQ